MYSSAGVGEDGMSRRNEQRKHGTTRGSPRQQHSEGIAYKPQCGEVAMCLRVGRMGPIVMSHQTKRSRAALRMLVDSWKKERVAACGLMFAVILLSRSRTELDSSISSPDAIRPDLV